MGMSLTGMFRLRLMNYLEGLRGKGVAMWNKYANVGKPMLDPPLPPPLFFPSSFPLSASYPLFLQQHAAMLLDDNGLTL